MDVSTLPIAEIKKIAKDHNRINKDFMHAISIDRRAGVQEIYRRLKRAESAMAAEMQRLEKMFVYEKDLWVSGYYPVAGVDEAGRGPLAGPVVAAAVILPEKIRLADIVYLNDSKKLSAAKREALARQIKKVALTWAVGVSTVEEINNKNIHHASLKAMYRAVLSLEQKPAIVLVDGFSIDRLELPQMPLTGGDGISASIAAASIIAKVYRDDLMSSCHELYPEYGFARHKGYGTPEHMRALALFGPCPLHRTGYRPVRNCGNS